MNEVAHFVAKHGYPILFAALFAHQLGLPVPGPLFLIAAGALAAAGKMGLVGTLVLAVTACVLGDWPWYEAGRRRGDRVLHFIHRLTRDPDAHDRRAKATFARWASHPRDCQVRPRTGRGDTSPGWDIADKPDPLLRL
jgi:membrane protein DedA with SNARE-associated domain